MNSGPFCLSGTPPFDKPLRAFSAVIKNLFPGEVRFFPRALVSVMPGKVSTLEPILPIPTLSIARWIVRSSHEKGVDPILGFSVAGGLMGFMEEKSRIRFAVNMDSAERDGLKISSKLLRIASIGMRGSGGDAK